MSSNGQFHTTLSKRVQPSRTAKRRKDTPAKSCCDTPQHVPKEPKKSALQKLNTDPTSPTSSEGFPNLSERKYIDDRLAVAKLHDEHGAVCVSCGPDVPTLVRRDVYSYSYEDFDLLDRLQALQICLDVKYGENVYEVALVVYHSIPVIRVRYSHETREFLEDCEDDYKHVLELKKETDKSPK